MAQRVTDHPTSVTDLNVCVSTESGRRNVGKDTTFREWLLNHQIGNHASRTPGEISTSQVINLGMVGISLTTVTMVFAVHNLYPSLGAYMTPFFQLSYYQPAKAVYVQGWDDIYLVMGLIVAFTAVRAITIEWIFGPIARYAGLKRKTAVRFAEQGWLLVYYGGFWSFGMVCTSPSSYPPRRC
jgi:very-long-chain ceramide synthase